MGADDSDMLTATAIAHLRRHQDALSTLLDDMAALLAGDVAAVRPALATMRWSIARCARGYQLFKHGEIFEPVIAHGDPAQATAAGDMRRACLAVSAEYEAHVRRWSARDMAAEWDAYCAEASAMMRRMRRHLVVERQQVERLLARAERTRRPA